MSEPPILTWMSDPDGRVWAIDAADVMTLAPEADPVRQMTWEEADAYIPAGTAMAAGAHISWHLSLIGAELVRVPAIALVARIFRRRRKSA